MSSGASILASVRVRAFTSQRKALLAYVTACRPRFFLNVGYCAPLEEIAEGAVQMAQRLVQRHARRLVQPGRFRVLLQGSECCRCFVIADALLPLIVGIRTQTQRPVVDKPRTPECPRQYGGLFRCWVEPIAICPFVLHAYNYRIELVSLQRAGGR